MVARLSGRKVVLTGASGFIGRSALGALVAAGADVTALLRNRHGVSAVAAVGARPIVAPLVAGSALAGALDGAQVLVHLAYDVRADGASNLAAFEALIAAAGKAGIEHVVHASSAVVYDDWPNGPIDETAPIGTRPASGYRAAKIAMEERLLAGPFAATILQPTIVWGPGSELWTERPIRAMRAGGFVLPDPAGSAPLVHVADVTAAIVGAVSLAAPGRERILLSGSENPPWEALFDGYRRIAGGGLLREPLEALYAMLPQGGTELRGAARRGPSAAARVSAALRAALGRERFGRIADRAARLRAGPVRPGHADLALFAASPSVDCSKAARLLAWRPVIDLDIGLALLGKD